MKEKRSRINDELFFNSSYVENIFRGCVRAEINLRATRFAYEAAFGDKACNAGFVKIARRSTLGRGWQSTRRLQKSFLYEEKTRLLAVMENARRETGKADSPTS